MIEKFINFLLLLSQDVVQLSINSSNELTTIGILLGALGTTLMIYWIVEKNKFYCILIKEFVSNLKA